MIMLNCVIIDDEQFSVDALLKYIDLLPYLNVNAIYTDPLLALSSASSAEAIDLVFMDVDMPSLSGIELAAVWRGKTKKLIFTTAHSKYAFEAFEVAADAFLLKPFSFAKFSITINRLFPQRNDSAAGNEYFLVKSKEDDLAIVKVRFDDVIAFESTQNHIKIYQSGDRVLTAYLTLKDVLQLTRSRPEFLQLHRAFIISTEHIGQIKGTTVLMNNQLSFHVGDIFREQFTAYVDEKLLVRARPH